MSNGKKLKPWVIPALIAAVLVIIGIVVGVSILVKGNSNKDDTGNQTTTSAINEGTVVNKDSLTKETIKGYVNTFSGYTSLFAANGGNKTQDGSNFDNAGLNVEISIQDDDDKIIEAFEKGDIQFFAMTVNKMSMVAKQLDDKGIKTVIPYFLDTSTGGDGIVTDNTVKNITDLKNVKIGMAKNSVSTAIPVWFLNKSGLSEAEVQKIVDNFVLFDSTQEAVDAFVAGKVGAVSTWDMTSALKKKNSHLLFSTASAEYLVIDGIVFNKEFADKHKNEITAMIDSIITTVNDINNDVKTQEYYDAIRKAVPDFADYSNEDMADEISYAKFLGYNGNLEAFDIANDIYVDFCKVWEQLGFKTNNKYKLIDDSYIKDIASKWEGRESSADSSINESAEEYVDQDALITQYAKILFNGDSAEFKTGYEKTNKELIDQFIKVAKVLNKTVIKISGHVNLGKGSTVWDETTQSYKLAPGFRSSEFAYKLSKMRAETVKDYMVSQGIPEERIIIEGLGGDHPIDTNDTEAGQANNRSCEISFYQAGY